mmetsp:Transcript_22237/g.65889  ORF Transcript_22237/g.65889 Transcript_22237/m.65889 type:complete len:94 (-) Transcript_22237:364-645(-)
MTGTGNVQGILAEGFAPFRLLREQFFYRIPEQETMAEAINPFFLDVSIRDNMYDVPREASCIRIAICPVHRREKYTADCFGPSILSAIFGSIF